MSHFIDHKVLCILKIVVGWSFIGLFSEICLARSILPLSTFLSFSNRVEWHFAHSKWSILAPMQKDKVLTVDEFKMLFETLPALKCCLIELNTVYCPIWIMHRQFILASLSFLFCWVCTDKIDSCILLCYIYYNRKIETFSLSFC